MIIAIHTAIKLFSWLSTLFISEITLLINYYYIIGFILLFLFNNLSSLILANYNLDILLHDTSYVVNHFHFILSLGALFSVLTYLSFILVRILKNYYTKYIQIISILIFIIKIISIFLPQHILGLYSNPRRIFCYPELYNYLNEIINLDIIIILMNINLFIEILIYL